MTKYGQLTILSIALLAFLFTGKVAISEDFKVGDIFVCESSAGLPPVYAFIGKVDTADELNQSGSTLTEPVIGAQLFTQDENRFPVVGHSPFSIGSFANCEAVAATDLHADQNRFSEGYAVWRTAFDNSEAGVWDLDIAEAYWAILGAITELPVPNFGDIK